MSSYKVYKVQFQMVDTFEVEIDLATSKAEAVKLVKESLEQGETFAENREFISWDTGVVRVVGEVSPSEEQKFLDDHFQIIHIA
jgi:hypothetical protein